MSTALTAPPRTADYVPGPLFDFPHRMRRFQLRDVPNMLYDARIQLGLRMIKGPILSNAEFEIESDDERIVEFVKDQTEKFWNTSAVKALKAIEWGFSGSEALYELDPDDGMLKFDRLKGDLHAFDLDAYSHQGQLVGFTVRGSRRDDGSEDNPIWIGGMRAFWHVHQRDQNPWYGVPRLKGAWEPWFEGRVDGGGKDLRRVYFHKFALRGEILYHPTGQDARGKDYNTLAVEMLQHRRSGGSLAIQDDRDTAGNRRWELIEASAGPGGTEIIDYNAKLDDEKLEGMGIPPEVVAAEGTGAFAGRKIPMEAFFSMEQEIVDCLLMDWKDQILTPLVQLNFGPKADYMLQAKKLIEQFATDSTDLPQTEQQQQEPPPPVQQPMQMAQPDRKQMLRQTQKMFDLRDEEVDFVDRFTSNRNGQ